MNSVTGVLGRREAVPLSHRNSATRRVLSTPRRSRIQRAEAWNPLLNCRKIAPTSVFRAGLVCIPVKAIESKREISRKPVVHGLVPRKIAAHLFRKRACSRNPSVTASPSQAFGQLHQLIVGLHVAVDLPLKENVVAVGCRPHVVDRVFFRQSFDRNELKVMRGE